MTKFSVREYLRDRYIPSRLDLKRSSAHQLIVAVNLLDRFAGRSVSLSELTPELITSFLRWLGESGRSPRTVNSRRSAIVTIWRHAARKGFAPRFDHEDVPRRKLPRRHPTAWKPEEMSAIVSHLDRAWLKTLAMFIYETGCRLNSAALLTWNNWNPRSRTMQLPTETAKTGLEQFVRVSESTAARIELLRLGMSDKIFPCPNDRRPIWRELKAACKAAGLPHTRRDLFQKIRRTTATWTAVATSVDQASRQLGHTSTRMTVENYIDPRFLPVVHAADVLPSLD